MGYLIFATFRSSQNLPFTPSRIEHPTFTRLNPPMGFTSRDWSEEMGPDAFPTTVWEWERVVNEFLSSCDHLGSTTGPEPMPLPRNNRPQAHSGTSSRASSISEGHVSPEDDGPSKKVVRYDD